MLFFILSISITFLIWIAVSSERVFEYVYMKRDFFKNRSFVHDKVLCADTFINNVIKSDYNNSFPSGKHTFIRNLYLKDTYICNIQGINIVMENNNMYEIFFIIDDYMFNYKFKNGFVDFVISFKLL